MTCSPTWVFKCYVVSLAGRSGRFLKKSQPQQAKKHQNNNYLFFLLHACRCRVREVKDGEAEFLVAMEALQHSDSDLLRVWVSQALWMNSTLNLCHTIGADHAVGLGHFRIWHERRYKWLLVRAMKKQIQSAKPFTYQSPVPMDQKQQNQVSQANMLKLIFIEHSKKEMYI